MDSVVELAKRADLAVRPFALHALLLIRADLRGIAPAAHFAAGADLAGPAPGEGVGGADGGARLCRA